MRTFIPALSGQVTVIRRKEALIEQAFVCYDMEKESGLDILVE